MKTKLISLLSIILGIMIISFPMIGVIGASAILGLSVLFIAMYALTIGISIIDYNFKGAVLDFILGIILLVISIALIFNPEMLGILTELSLYIAGIILIIGGVISILNNRDSHYAFYSGIVGIILGVLYIIIGTFLKDPLILGIFIGVWLMINGVFKLLDG